MNEVPGDSKDRVIVDQAKAWMSDFCLSFAKNPCSHCDRVDARTLYALFLAVLF